MVFIYLKSCWALLFVTVTETALVVVLPPVFMDRCPTCCSPCTPGACAPSSMPASPSTSLNNLENFLPAGTVQISLLTAPDVVCNHVHAQDGWDTFSEPVLQKHVEPSFHQIVQSIAFLINGRFIAGTCRLTFPKVLIRIYLIPYDLPGANGRLSLLARKRENAQFLSLTKQHMHILFSKIVPDPGSWMYGHSHTLPESSFISSETRTISEVYTNMPSPRPEPHGSSRLVSRLFNMNDSLDGLGLRSTLHKYQRESVAAMLEREQPDQLDKPNPLYIPLKGLDGRTFFYQPGTSEILQEKNVVSIPPGGILCEELGTGKTVMILALILGTLKQLSSPEESVIEARPILTPLAFRHFHSPEISALRNRFPNSITPTKLPRKSEQSRVPSFREFILHQLSSCSLSSVPDRTSSVGIAKDDRQRHLAEKLERIPMYSAWRKSNTPFYFHFRDELSYLRTSSRGHKDPGPRTMYLSAATLIIVPPNLISQWEREIHKHCLEDPRLLIVRSKTVLPPAKDLAMNYDIILMTYSRFCDEDRHADIDSAFSWKPPNLSPLLQIRWKRLVIDEGHVSSSLSTRLTPFTKLLSIQSRWVVTGTPTTNMLGLGFGGPALDNEGLNNGILDDPEVMQCSEILNDPLQEAVSPLTRQGPLWSTSDNRDISKLLNIISQFLGVKFLSADSQTIRTHIKDALFSNQGPRLGSTEMLEKFMTMFMIRHRVTDIDIELPKLTLESVLLDLDQYSVLSYNALQAAILINAIDSERKDQDYMFHPQNAEYLQLTVKNMSQLMFWQVDSNLYNVEELAGNTEKLIQNVKSKKKSISMKDLSLTEKALHHVRLACQNALWAEIQKHEDVPYQVSRIPDPILKAWSRLSGLTADVDLMHPDRLIKLRQQVLQHPLSDEIKLCSVGNEVARTDLLRRRLYQTESRKGRKDRLISRKLSLTAVPKSTNDSVKTRSSASGNSPSSDNIKEMQRELHAALARLDALEADHDPSVAATSTTATTQSSQINSILVHQSPVAHSRIGKTLSSKLNFIIEEVQKYSATEKFLIFSDSPLTLAHVYEALTLLQIKSLQFTTQTSQLVREQLVLTFETSDVYRVFLMELKHGARGLNLVSASRVIFCEPVWQADVESQAIKRAHRIGQTKPVSVKTLVIRRTAEEKMLDRRRELQRSGSKTPKLLEEAGIRHFIENPEFLESVPDSQVGVRIDFPLFHLQRSSLPRSPTSYRRVRLRVEDPVEKSLDKSSTPKRTVRFM
ncbi:hypothetical protein D9757_002922 [Collybiopsis confluens]|uniref:Uncharacterized protein n=1 Tax=Collybiopsis confluens TaxID=2823264 RepID=A0A8H5MDY6_9AGAR|nr:hypothetical protein D9757_002922 [Collybiopsis confluens]